MSRSRLGLARPRPVPVQEGQISEHPGKTGSQTINGTAKDGRTPLDNNRAAPAWCKARVWGPKVIENLENRAQHNRLMNRIESPSHTRPQGSGARRTALTGPTKISSPASVFEKLLRAFETGGFTYTQVLAELKRLLATGASPTELLEVLRRRELIEPLPEYAHVEVIGLLNDAVERAIAEAVVSTETQNENSAPSLGQTPDSVPAQIRSTSIAPPVEGSESPAKATVGRCLGCVDEATRRFADSPRTSHFLDSSSHSST